MTNVLLCPRRSDLPTRGEPSGPLASLPWLANRARGVLLSLLVATVSHGAEPAASSTAPDKSSRPAVESAGTSLFDGNSLMGWKVTDFAGHGKVLVDPGFKLATDTNVSPAMVIDMGAILTGVTWTNEPPVGDYEVSLDAAKLEGDDFFCALTFPAGGGHCSLIVGGWGGGVVGISSLDGMDASENETTKFRSFEKNRWYHIRVRVTKDRIQAWIDQERVVDVATTDRRVTVRAGEIELNQPLGLAAYATKAAYRNLRLRHL